MKLYMKEKLFSFHDRFTIKDENGWDKWNDIQGDFFNIILAADCMPEDVIVYFLSHLQTDENGNEKIKTMGKMLDEKITIEGLFTTVLKTSVNDGKYYFLTQNSGKDTVKSPIGMFDSYAIDNDLKYVDTKIRNYYEIGDYKPDEEVKQMDAEHLAPEVEKPDADGRKRRRKVNNEEKNNVEKEPEQAQIEDAKEETAPKRRGRKPRGADSAGTDPASGEAADNTGSDSGAVLADAEPKKRRRRSRNEEKTIEELTNEVPF